jgi:hypothetical protein
MNMKDPPFRTPMPAAARRLGETFDDFEAALARSVADGSRLARLLIQLLVMLREALVRFATGVSPDTAMLAVPGSAMADVADMARPMRARRIRAASRQLAARGLAAAVGLVAADGLTSVAVPVATTIWARARDRFSWEWVGIERVGFSKNLSLAWVNLCHFRYDNETKLFG